MNRLLLRILLLLALAAIVGETLFSKQRSITEISRLDPSSKTAKQDQQRPQNFPVSADEPSPLTTAQVARRSARVVLVKCISVDVREVGSGNIFTFLDFELIQIVKGRLPRATFTLRVFGGRVGDVEITSPVTVKFSPGDKYVLFLGRDNSDGYPTMTPDHLFEVRTSPLDNREVVVPNPTGLELFRAKDGLRYSSSPSLLPLEDLLLSLAKAK